ncbi:MAG: hypothetical protein J6C82_06965 [Clostridia bacterium]|nr:hypothetical protein [Clostridia bacterium]
MKKLLSLLCAAAITLSAMPVLAEDTGTTWVDPDPVEAFVDELDASGTTSDERKANFLNSEDSGYVSQRDGISPNASELIADLGAEAGTVFRRAAGWYTEESCIVYRVNPGWKLAVKTFDVDNDYNGAGDVDIQLTFKGTHYRIEYSEIESVKVNNGYKIMADTNKHLYMATHYIDIPDDVYWVKICLPECNSDGTLGYDSWKAGIMSVSMWDNEFTDELNDDETEFLSSRTATYMPQRYAIDTNRIQYSSGGDAVGSNYQSTTYGGGDRYLTYAVAGGRVAEIEYRANKAVSSALDCIRLFASEDGSTFTQLTDTKNPTSHGSSGNDIFYREYALLPEGTAFLKVMLPEYTGSSTAAYTNWHIGIMTVEVRDADFYDDIEDNFSNPAGGSHAAQTYFSNSAYDGYIIQRAGANEAIQYSAPTGTIGGTAIHMGGYFGKAAWLSYKAWPGKQFVVNSSNYNTSYELTLYASETYTTDTANWTQLTTVKEEGEAISNANGTAAKQEIYTATVPEGMYYVYMATPSFPLADGATTNGDTWKIGIRNVTMQDVPTAPKAEYEHTNPGDTAVIEDAKLILNGSVTKNSGESEKVYVFLASYTGSTLTDVDCESATLSSDGKLDYSLSVDEADAYRLFIWKGEIEPIAKYEIDTDNL